MSMLAEKKRREKWSLNPRGKAWSEDQNKFGQRLMEKMGWKTGQGLGASSQGQTDIVKTRVKNDSKGLGFKENGEEWLKTTSDFDNLLDELASGHEDSGEGSQSETVGSLEDRSKKSKARVHYHKFTRGKDLSRYSEKDLASIIGPDVIKLKNGQESKNDYTPNQVNKGSLEEYFSKKLKSKGAKSADNSELRDLNEDDERAVKKRKRNIKGDVVLSGYNDNYATNSDVDKEIVAKKKTKKSKGDHNQNPEHLEDLKTECNEEYSSGNPVVAGETAIDNKTLSKKKKKKFKGKSNEPQEEPMVEEQIATKKKRKEEKEDEPLDGDSRGTRKSVPHHAQVVSLNKAGDFLEVLGRRTRLKNVKAKLPGKTKTDDSYKTEDFMSFGKTDLSKKAGNKFIENQTNSGGATTENVKKHSVLAKSKLVFNKAEKKTKTSLKKIDDNSASDVNNSKSATTGAVNDEKENYFKCFGEANPEDCSVPKHVVAYEYRLVAARLKHLGITLPEVKVIIKESNKLNQTTLRKLKQIAKTRHFKTLLPQNDLTEVEATVTTFYNKLKPKIEIMEAVAELEEKVMEIARNLSAKPESSVNDEEKGVSSQNELIPDLLKKLETLHKRIKETKAESSTSDDTMENSDAEDAENQSGARCSWLERVESKVDLLSTHMNLLAKGELPLDLNINKKSQIETKNNKKRPTKSNNGKVNKNNHYKNTSYSRGRISHNVRMQRGRGRGRGRIHSGAKSAVPSGGWGVLKSYGSATDQGLTSENENCKAGFTDAGGAVRQGRAFSRGGRFSGRGRSSRGGEGLSGRGRGLSGRGRGLSGRGRFLGEGRGAGFMGRGRGDSRGRGRGRISQTNLEAKVYAEHCKELNKMPEVCFSGVNMKVISGYAAPNTSVDKTVSSS